MIRLKSLVYFALAAVMIHSTAVSSWACTACFGQSDSSLARGMNMGIFALLLIITSVLCGVAGFFVYLARRTAQIEEANAHLARSLSQNQTNA